MSLYSEVHNPSLWPALIAGEGSFAIRFNLLQDAVDVRFGGAPPGAPTAVNIVGAAARATRVQTSRFLAAAHFSTRGKYLVFTGFAGADTEGPCRSRHRGERVCS
mmetsp:Transcript_24981/g.49150  ORF Transcript_24981/g.49150 Transcript_24981/m.49150 type:complete len:105 (-) Transcript_24981:2587-2901(-)